MQAKLKRYPWDDWLRPGTFTATRGDDFTCRLDNFIGILRQKASKRRLHLSIQVSRDERFVTVRVRQRDLFSEN